MIESTFYNHFHLQQDDDTVETTGEEVIDLTRPTENNPTVSRAEKKPDTEKLPDTGILSSRYLYCQG